METKINNRQLFKVIRQSLRENLMKYADVYKFNDLELSEYTRLQSNLTGINACIYIDECASFKRWRHPLWVIVSQGDPYQDSWVALSVNQNPRILTQNHTENKISKDIINECKQFVSKFYKIILKVALEQVDSSIMYDILENSVWTTLSSENIDKIYHQLKKEYFLEESQKSVKLITEMAILRPQLTNLPCCLWIEPEGRITQHNDERIKFQDTDSTNSNEFYPIRLTSDGAILSNCKRPCHASSKVQKEVLQFVNTYRAILDGFITGKIDERQLKQLIKSKQTQLPTQPIQTEPVDPVNP